MKRALLRSDQLGMQPLSARAHSLLAVAECNFGDQNDALRDAPDDLQAVALAGGMKKGHFRGRGDPLH